MGADDQAVDGAGSTRRAWVVGSINRDIVGYVARHGRPGETVLGTRSAEFPGGKGANQAVALARLGSSVSLIGRVGADAFGTVMQAFLASEGVDVTGVSVNTSTPTGVALIVVDATSENIITVLPGANMDWPGGIGSYFRPARGDIVSAQLEIPIEIVEAAFAATRVAGALTVLNPSPYAARAVELMTLTDVLVVNEGELAQMTGQAIERASIDTVTVACRAAFAKGVRAVVVTLGADGAVVVTADGAEVIAGLAVVPRDTTGAGDCFTGALIAEMLRGAGIVDAARFAVRAAAVSVTRDGAAASYPRRDEI